VQEVGQKHLIDMCIVTIFLGVTHSFFNVDPSKMMLLVLRKAKGGIGWSLKVLGFALQKRMQQITWIRLSRMTLTPLQYGD
jgi:hypothetical protein